MVPSPWDNLGIRSRQGGNIRSQCDLALAIAKGMWHVRLISENPVSVCLNYQGLKHRQLFCRLHRMGHGHTVASQTCSLALPRSVPSSKSHFSLLFSKAQVSSERDGKQAKVQFALIFFLLPRPHGPGLEKGCSPSFHHAAISWLCGRWCRYCTDTGQ